MVSLKKFDTLYPVELVTEYIWNYIHLFFYLYDEAYILCNVSNNFNQWGIMKQYLDMQFLLSQLSLWWEQLSQALFQVDTLVEGVAILLSLVLAYILSQPLANKLVSIKEQEKKRHPLLDEFLTLFPPLIQFILAIFFLTVSAELLAYKSVNTFIIATCSRLVTAWALIHFSTGILRKHKWTRALSILIWGIATLHILGLLLPLIEILDQLAISIGKIDISIILVCKAVILFVLMLKAVGLFSRFIEKHIHALPDITPSIQVLLSKIVKITLIFLAVIITLSVLGIDISAFAFIGGAIGVGLGFGLQKVVSNLVSGIILLLDRSIKPGDVIEIGSTYGRIKSLGARYVSVATRDNTEYLIPNEDLIVNQVVNWSFTNALIRLKILFPVAYNSDIHQVMELITTTAASVPRVLQTPQPSCQLKEFGNSSLDIELRLWIADPENGVSNVKSAVRIAVWDVFTKNCIEIPYPHMDIYMWKGTSK